MTNHLFPIGELCVAIPRVRSLKGYSYRNYERVWDRGTFIVTEAHFLIKKFQKISKIEKMAKKLSYGNGPMKLKIWPDVPWVEYEHLPR